MQGGECSKEHLTVKLNVNFVMVVSSNTFVMKEESSDHYLQRSVGFLDLHHALSAAYTIFI